MKKLLTLAIFFLTVTAPALAQNAGTFNINVDGELLSANRVFQMVILVTVMSIAPSILVMVTSFTRIVVVFSFLRSAMGLQTTPPNTVLVSLALFLTMFIMAPTLDEAYNKGLTPYLNGKTTEEQAFIATAAPFKTFMMGQVNEKDLGLFIGILAESKPDVTIEDPPLRALVPAFMISELRRSFEIGFLIFLPFVIIDLTIASILMSMGMMMLPPVMISLPFKVIFFVLVDGWHLLVGSLVKSFAN